MVTKCAVVQVVPGNERRERQMAAPNLKDSVPLCPEHLGRMKLFDVHLADALNHVKQKVMFGCTEISCNWKYSLATGYLRFREGERVEAAKSLRMLCPEHRRPLFISGYNTQNKVASWCCPERPCETHREIPLQFESPGGVPEETT